MAKPRHDWYFNEWLAYFEKSQADVSSALEWNKAKVSLFAAGKQRYHRDDLNELAALLNLEPFELLMPPDRAMMYRQVIAEGAKAAKLVHDAEPANHLGMVAARKRAAQKGEGRKKTGTHG